MHDILFFGVTGFTGQLALDYLVDTKWWTSGKSVAVCGRSHAKVAAAVEKAYGRVEAGSGEKFPRPEIVIADLVGDGDVFANLESLVKNCRVVCTAAGPFDKYAQNLVRICAENGKHYCDITGETDFVRSTVTSWDHRARETGAKIVCHCGNDCIPYDALVYTMHEEAKTQNTRLVDVMTYTEVPPTAAMSGGTLATAMYQLSKTGRGAKGHDPLLQKADGQKSEFVTKITVPKSSVYVKEFSRSAGPWIMAQVMANCVRRSNALLGYHENFSYGEALLEFESFGDRMRLLKFKCMVGLALYVPYFRSWLPQPGEGPPMEDMLQGWLNVHARGKLENGKNMEATFSFPKDTGYLQTAHMLIESAFLLLESAPGSEGGVLTPAAAFGSACVPRMEQKLGAKCSVKIVD